MNPPMPSQKEIEPEQNESVEVTEEDTHDKREGDADNEIISHEVCTDLVAYVAEKVSPGANHKAWCQGSLLPTRLLPAPSTLFYNPQSFLAKGVQMNDNT